MCSCGDAQLSMNLKHRAFIILVLFLCPCLFNFSGNVHVSQLFVKAAHLKKKRFQEATVYKEMCDLGGFFHFLGNANFINFMRRPTAHTLSVHS